MNAQARGVIERSGGIITREQALGAGLAPGQIRNLVRKRIWVIVRRGVYADAEVWDAADDYRGKPRIRTRAALSRMRRDWVLSHDSSAHELGLDILTPKEPYVHITRPGFTAAWTEYGVKHHLARFRPEQVLDADGLKTLDLARTAVDIARERDEDHGLAALDGAMRMGVTREQLWSAVEPMTNWPHVTRVRRGIEDADPGAQTIVESLGRRFALELGIGRPETQFPVVLATGTVWCDLRIGCHVIEIDGKIKYTPSERGGVATRHAEDVVMAEKRRETLVRAEGLGMSRLTFADFFGGRRAEAKVRVLAEWRVTVERFGRELPEHLERNAREIRGRRGA